MGILVSSVVISVQVEIYGISVGLIGLSYAKGFGLRVAGVTLSCRYWSIGNILSYSSELGPLILHQNMLFHGHIEIPQLSKKCYKFPSNICYFQIPLQLVSKVIWDQVTKF